VLEIKDGVNGRHFRAADQTDEPFEGPFPAPETRISERSKPSPAARR
jgi:hypothetical protein